VRPHTLRTRFWTRKRRLFWGRHLVTNAHNGEPGDQISALVISQMLRSVQMLRSMCVWVCLCVCGCGCVLCVCGCVCVCVCVCVCGCVCCVSADSQISAGAQIHAQAPPCEQLVSISSQAPSISAQAPREYLLISTPLKAPPHKHLLVGISSQAPLCEHLLTSTSCVSTS
jgi:hypothetical protein